MKKTLGILLIILLASISFAQDFRNATWGMSRAEVQAVETAEFLQEESDALVYEASVAELDTVIIYTFEGDSLIQAGYIFQEDHIADANYIQDYDKVQNILIRNYGEKDIDEVWVDDLYRDDPRSEWGMAIATGRLTFNAAWETDTTGIFHVMTGEDFEISHAVIYNDLLEADSQESKNEEEEDAAF